MLVCFYAYIGDQKLSIVFIATLTSEKGGGGWVAFVGASSAGTPGDTTNKYLSKPPLDAFTVEVVPLAVFF